MQNERQEMICGIHNVLMQWKTGVSQKTNKPYAFWSCDARNNDGSYCRWKPNNPSQPTPTQQFGATMAADNHEQNIRKAFEEKQANITQSVALNNACVLMATNSVPSESVNEIGRRTLELARMFLEWLNSPKTP